MNKMITAVAILQLVEAGKIELTAPVGDYLTDYPNPDVATTVTIHHLLTHTGGTGDIFGPTFDAHRDELRTHHDYVELYGSRGPEFDPGTRWAYSNYGFVLLGAIIEAVTGQTYYDYVDDHIYQPAGMTATGSLPETEAVPDRSIGYTTPTPGGEWNPNTDTLPYRGTAAGGGYSTVEDLTRFAEALLEPPLAQPRQHRPAVHRQSGLGSRRRVRLRVRGPTRRRRERPSRPQRRRTRHERRPQDLPELRLRRRRAGQPRPTRSTTNLVIPPPAAPPAIAPSSSTPAVPASAHQRRHRLGQQPFSARDDNPLTVACDSSCRADIGVDHPVAPPAHAPSPITTGEGLERRAPIAASQPGPRTTGSTALRNRRRRPR